VYLSQYLPDVKPILHKFLQWLDPFCPDPRFRASSWFDYSQRNLLDSSMTRALSLCCLIALSAACSQVNSTPAVGVPDAAAAYVPGEVIVRFRDGTPRETVQRVLAAVGGMIARELGAPRTYLIRLSDDRVVPDAIRTLQGMPDVAYAEPNRIVRLEPPARSGGVPTKPQ
jgi:hypothetical protein